MGRAWASRVPAKLAIRVALRSRLNFSRLSPLAHDFLYTAVCAIYLHVYDHLVGYRIVLGGRSRPWEAMVPCP
jgi:hypothetical protein